MREAIRTLMTGVGSRWYYAPGQPLQQVILEIEYEEHTQLDDQELQRLLQKQGNAPEHLCLECGRTPWIDPRYDALECWWCGGAVVKGFALVGRTCPRCKQGVIENRGIGAIS